MSVSTELLHVTRLRPAMKRPAIAAFAALCAATCLFAESDHERMLAGKGTDGGYSLRVKTSRDDALCAAGSNVVFLVSLTRGETPVTNATVQYEVKREIIYHLDSGNVRLVDGKGAITIKAPEQGFMKCRVNYNTPTGKTIWHEAAAGVDVYNIVPALKPPPDFEEFWEARRAELSKVPAAVLRMTPVQPVIENVESFDVRVRCLGEPVSGYYTRPAGAKAGSCPAFLRTHGAGVYKNWLNWTYMGAQNGMIAFSLNAHGIDNDGTQEYYDELSSGRLSNYVHQGKDNRDTAYLLGMYLRIIRAIDFLTAQPEWDGKIVVVSGESQGGGQSLAAAGLDKRVTAIVAGVPGMCDHAGASAGRAPGWPRFVRDEPGKEQVLEASRYYDNANFARLITADAFLTVGFHDDTCPPSSIFAVYNVLKCTTKQIDPFPLRSHDGMDGGTAERWLLERVRYHSQQNTRSD